MRVKDVLHRYQSHSGGSSCASTIHPIDTRIGLVKVVLQGYDSYGPWNVHASLLSGIPGLSMQYIFKNWIAFIWMNYFSPFGTRVFNELPVKEKFLLPAYRVSQHTPMSSYRTGSIVLQGHKINPPPPKKKPTKKKQKTKKRKGDNFVVCTWTLLRFEKQSFVSRKAITLHMEHNQQF